MCQQDHLYQRQAFTLPRGLHLGVAALGTVQVTIDERSVAIRANFMAGAATAVLALLPADIFVGCPASDFRSVCGVSDGGKIRVFRVRGHSAVFDQLYV